MEYYWHDFFEKIVVPALFDDSPDREKIIKKLALYGFGKKLCPGGKWKNFAKYQTCRKCKSDISGVEAKEEVLVFFHLERFNGNEKSQPFSIGLVAMKSDRWDVF